MNKQNRLSQASSPYLRQHADNPVDWYEWGDEALLKAKTENKPLIISIGYAACHWCHVMAHESFSDEEIAEFMNFHFVCIKIDREERPDIDRIYMEAAQLLSGRGGWPLNAFALPDGRPFYAATYFPPDQWMDALHQFIHLFQNEYPRVLQAATSLTEGIRTNPLPGILNSKPFNKVDYREAYENQINAIDFKLGGTSGAPKFMMPTGLEFLLQYHYLTGDQKALDAVTITLDAMAKGGIYDQVGGGFSRYSTDQYWKVPHFEKMLYDNAQLITLYALAYQLTNKPLYAEIVEQTIEFAERELRHSEGGFYASIDADSEHEEGKFYVWSKQDVESVLDPATAEIVLRFYQVSDYGNWEKGKNILHYKDNKVTFAGENGMSVIELKAILQTATKSLLEQRNNRIRPATDDKILTSWNALMISGYVNAFRALGNEQLLKGAISNARFLETNMLRDNGLLFRVYKDGKVSTEAFLDDYALLTDAYISLYEVTFDLHWLQLSQLLTGYVLNHFADAENQLFFYTSDQAENLIARKHEISDNVIPASNSVFAHVLFKLGILLEKADYTQMANEMLFKIRRETVQQGAYYANWAMLLGKMVYPTFEVSILGENAVPFNLEMQKKYLPTAVFAGGINENLPLLHNRLVENETVIYVCQNKTCNSPVISAIAALELIKADF
ncbi:MAG: thioredoxin domain-containing protein [Mariniphaga sp.]|nr:thioredoxin domain-containing protein [Mariniphaga sp.]